MIYGYNGLQAAANGVDPRVQECLLNRAYYHDELVTIFKDVAASDRPSVPTALLSTIINRSVESIFPDEAEIIPPEELVDVVDSLLEETQFYEKLGLIGTEGHVTGTVAIKSVYEQLTKQWTLDIHPAEELIFATDPFNAERIYSVTVRFKYLTDERNVSDGSPKLYWHQERWTDKELLTWPDQIVTEGQLPDYRDEVATVIPHLYGELPLTVIRHKRQLNSPYGQSEITPAMRALARRLAISEAGVDLAGQVISKPMLVRVNDVEQRPIVIKPAGVIDLQGGDTENAQTPSLTALEYQDTPASIFEYQRNLRAKAFSSARVPNPDDELKMRMGATLSAVALKALNQPFIKRTEGLRTQYGKNGVVAHVEKVLRMGKRLSLPEYAPVNELDPASYNLGFTFPPFFEPSIEEVQAEVNLLQSVGLPPETEARRIATLLGIDSEDVIQEMIETAEERQSLGRIDPSLLQPDPNAGA